MFNNESECETSDHPFLNPHLYPLETTEEVLYGWVLPGIALVGLLSNTLILFTLLHSSSHKASRYPSLDFILKAIAIYDSLLLLLSLWFFFLPTFRGHRHQGFIQNPFPVSIPFIYPIFRASITGCNYLTVLLGMERLLALDDRFRESESWRSGIPLITTRKYVAMIVLFTTAFNVPLFFESSVTTTESEPIQVLETPFKCHPVYYKLYRLTMELLIFKITTWCVLGMMFYSIAGKFSFFTSKSRRYLLSIKHVQQLRDSHFILGLISLFCICNALPLAISLANILLFELPIDVLRIGNLFFVINASLKLLVYVALFPNFRDRIVDLFLHPCTEYFNAGAHVTSSRDRGRAFLSPLEVTASHLDRMADKEERPL